MKNFKEMPMESKQLRDAKEATLEVVNEGDGLAPFIPDSFDKIERRAFIDLVTEGAIEIYEDNGLLIACWVGY